MTRPLRGPIFFRFSPTAYDPTEEYEFIQNSNECTTANNEQGPNGTIQANIVIQMLEEWTIDAKTESLDVPLTRS